MGVMRDADVEVYEKHADELIRFAGVLVGPSGAEDLFVTAFLRAVAAPRWPAIANQRAYLFRVLVNEAIRTRRATDRRLAREARVAPTESFEPHILDADVLRALRSLTVRQRAVVHLTYWLDLSQEQVARSLGLSLRTVERELAAARRQLEVQLR